MKTDTSTKIYLPLRVAAALYAPLYLASIVVFILTMTTGEWSFVGFYVIGVTVGFLTGVMLTGYAVLRSIWSGQNE